MPPRLSLTLSLFPALQIAAALLAPCGRVQAQLPVPASTPAPAPVAQGLVVLREPGAEHCADTVALLARIEQLRGRPDAGASAGYRVVFARVGDGLVATISSGTEPVRTRELRDQGATCAALEHATALSLSLLLDAEARERTQRDAERHQPTPIASRDAEPAPALSASGAQPDAGDDELLSPGLPARAPLRAQLSLGAGISLGLSRSLAPAFVAELGLGTGRARAAVTACFVPPQTHALGPGTIDETLWAGALRACFAPWLGSGLRLDACSGLHAGALHAAADGFTRDAAATKLWLALPVELALSSTWLPAGWELTTALLWPLRREDFAIEGAGVAYASPNVAGLLSVRGYLAWEW